MAKDASATLNLVLTPSAVGSITNSAIASTTTSDLNTGNNSASVVTPVIAQTADLAIGVSGSSDLLILGQDLTYNIIVTNLGPGSATEVTVTEHLPFGVGFVSATPAGYV